MIGANLICISHDAKWDFNCLFSILKIIFTIPRNPESIILFYFSQLKNKKILIFSD